MQVEAGRNDAALVTQYHTACSSWRSVLQRVVAVVKHLSTGNEAFQGEEGRMN